MNKTINPKSPGIPCFEEKEFSSWSENEKLAFILRILTIDDPNWSMEERKQFLNKFDPRDHYVYKGEEMEEFSSKYVKLILEARHT